MNPEDRLTIVSPEELFDHLLPDPDRELLEDLAFAGHDLETPNTPEYA